jgi:hypothetical protein
MFEDLAELLNRTGDEERQQTFVHALDNFGAILRSYPEIRIYVEAASGLGHQGSTIHVMTRLIQTFAYTRRIRIVYQPGTIKETGLTVEKLALLIPGFNPLHPENDIDVLGATVSALPWDRRDELGMAAFGFTGGANEELNLATELRSVFFLRLQPYFWAGPQQIERFEVADVVDLDDLFGVTFYRRAYYYEPPEVNPEQWTWYETHGTDEQRLHATLAHTLVDNIGGIHLCPVYGVRERTETGQYPDETLAQIAISIQAAKRAPGGYGGPAIIVSLDDDINDQSYIALARILAGGLSTNEVNFEQRMLQTRLALQDPAFSGNREESQEFITSVEGLLRNANLRAGFLANSGLANGVSILRNVDANALLVRLQALRQEPNQVVIFQLGKVPTIIYQKIFSIATLPSFFEGQGTANVALSLGLPYLHIPRPGSKLNNYPATTLQLPNASAIADGMATVARSVTAGFSNEDNSFETSSTTIATFIKGVCAGGPNPIKAYFQSIRAFYAVPSNDKLLVAIVYLRYYAQAIGLPVLDGESAALGLRAAPSMSLDDLWESLNANCHDGALNFIPGSISSGPIADFYKKISPSGVAIEGVQLNAERDAQQQIVRITATQGHTAAFGFPMTAELEFTAPLSPIVCVGRYESPEPWNLLGMPWIVLEKGGFSLTLIDDIYPAQGTIFATVQRAGLTVSLTFPTPEDAWLLEFRTAQPVGLGTMFDLAGGVNLLRVLPAPLAALGGFGATGVDLCYQPATTTLQSVQVYLGTKQPWTILDGRLSITDVAIAIGVISPASRDRKVVGRMDGKVVIGSGTNRAVIQVGAVVPGLQVAGELVEGVLTIENLLAIFLPGVRLDLPAVPKITQFLFRYSSTTGDYSVSCNLNVNWTLSIPGIPDIRLDDLSMSIQRARAGATGGIMASFTVGESLDGEPLRIALSAGYLGTGVGWEFAGRQISGTISLARLVERFLPAGWQFGDAYRIRDVGFTVAPTSKKYTFFGATDGFWTVPFLPDLKIAGDLRLVYSGVPEGEFSGRIGARVVFYFIDIETFYTFGPQPEWGFTWGILSGKVAKNEEQEWVGTLTLGTTSIGAMVETMVGWATGQTFNLASPWDFLNAITFNNLELQFNFTTDQVSLVFALAIDVGFASITRVSLTYDPGNRTGLGGRSNPPVAIEIDGRFFWQIGQEQKPLAWDATRPETTPAPPGNGNKYLDLRLLALGQHVTVEGLTETKTVQKAIEKMATMKDPEPGKIPDVTFDPESAWLIGADFGVIKFGGDT